MSLQQVVQPRSSTNGFGRRKVEREPGARLQNKLQSGKTNPSNLVNAGLLNGSKAGGYESPSRDRLLYLTTCLIGHNVEVQVKSGSIFSGIFHAANVEKDFGIILRMARLKKDCSFKGQIPGVDSFSIAPSKTIIVPAKELVQVIAKGVPVTEDGLTRVQGEKRQEIMTDSIISQSHFFEVERELERWTPDEDYPQCPGLENIFDGSWNRNWDQFETNETLFGVKSTFDEELYTTKLERGPQTRELEREALRIAREIEGEETQDLHLAEERGLHLHENFVIDEETRFSSVYRTVDDSGHEESEVMTLDSCNAETFGISSGPLISRTFSDVTRKKSDNGAHASSSSSSLDEAQSFQSNGSKYLYRSGSGDHDRQPGIGCASKSLPASDSTSRTHEKQLHECLGGKNFPKEFSERITITEEAQTSNSKGTEASVPLNKASSNKVGLSPSAAAYAPSCVSSKVHENMVSQVESTDSAVSGKTCGMVRPGNSQGRPDSSTSATSDCVGGASASSGPGLSPSSSVGSFSSEKSTLNPHAKEFKLNPNAKSFTPSRTPLRPPSPVSDGSFYFPTNASSIPHGMPVGIGIGPPYAQQPVIINPQTVPMQSPQPFIHQSGGPMYQQMILGHPRQVMYMPSYPPEMQYK